MSSGSNPDRERNPVRDIHQLNLERTLAHNSFREKLVWQGKRKTPTAISNRPCGRRPISCARILNAVLGLEGEHAIAEITILNPYQAPKIDLLKETNLDLRAKTQQGVTFIVEMQVEKEDFFAKRALYYTSKAYVGQIQRGDQYPKLNQVIFVGILDFSLFDGDDYLSTHLIVNQNTLKQEIKDFELNFIELPKFHKQEQELDTIIEKWVYFFKHAGNLTVIPKPLSEPPELIEAFELLEQHTWTQEELDIYESWLIRDASHLYALETAKRDGFKQGLEQGRKQSTLDLADTLLQDGMPLEQVMKYTGLSREELEQLQQGE